MNDSLKAGLQQIEDAAFLAGYRQALENMRLEIHAAMNEHPGHSCELWGLMGALSRLKAEASRVRPDGDPKPHG